MKDGTHRSSVLRAVLTFSFVSLQPCKSCMSLQPCNALMSLPLCNACMSLQPWNAIMSHELPQHERLYCTITKAKKLPSKYFNICVFGNTRIYEKYDLVSSKFQSFARLKLRIENRNRIYVFAFTYLQLRICIKQKMWNEIDRWWKVYLELRKYSRIFLHCMFHLSFLSIICFHYSSFASILRFVHMWMCNIYTKHFNTI